MTPEALARQKIDALLIAAGWRIQDREEMNLGAALGVAVREYPPPAGPCDYLLFVDRRACGVIEAKPEELRIFLEEAAGVSKYKERRKETEGRIADTRENLARVSDIRTELGSQLGKLEAQAKVATRYNELHSDLQLKQ